MKKIHLVCNAHLDPVWLWEWEEGAAEAISTFRIAADFCEEYGGFVFNHNEVILYKWVQEYEPVLFKRIQRLVREGKWHIMGGWFLQPDCNMPSGESFVRQILSGRMYFKKYFGKEPTTAINFDPFGHTRGLVQIMRGAGYDSYLFCRPIQKDCPIPGDTFVWEGYEGSQVIGQRAYVFYNTKRGEAAQRVRNWMKHFPEEDTGLILWGIGNHGGGPSRIDLERLTELMDSQEDYQIIHSTPEAYFKEVALRKEGLPKVAKSLNPWAVGCYTSQIRIKQKHRALENQLYMVEKMASAAAIRGEMAYPENELKEALSDLLFSEFHDILPGSSIKPVEEAALRMMDHGLEILSRVKARAFFALAAGQKKAQEGEIPIFVYNPYPYSVTGIFECEFQLADISEEGEFWQPVVKQDGRLIPCQTEKEYSNLPIDWRKHVVFYAELQPGQMNRFDCTFNILTEKPKPKLEEQEGKIIFVSDDMEVVINCTTGLMDRYRVKGVDYLEEGACKPLVMEDNHDSWGMNVDRFRSIVGDFTLVSEEKGTKYSGVHQQLKSVRVIEDGAVRTVVEAILGYGDSYICQRYKLPKQGTEIEIELTVMWNEQAKMLKLSLPTVLGQGRYYGQQAYGFEELPSDGQETAAQKWGMIACEQSQRAFSCTNNGTYGSDVCDGELRLSLLRSPGYSAHPFDDKEIMPQDRYSHHVDQGERVFRFWINGGEYADRLENIDHEAQLHNEKPFTLSFFPAGGGTSRNADPIIILSDKSVSLSAFKKAEESNDYIIRLYETTGCQRDVSVKILCAGLAQEIHMKGHQIKTYKLDIHNKLLIETGLMENEL